MIELLLKRKLYNKKQTLGTMEVYKNNVFQCVLSTLEPEWLNNQQNISCIKEGNYIVNHYSSDKFKDVFILENVENRSYILIHGGNFYQNTKGCIIVGLAHIDINNDKLKDVKHSTEALNLLRDICRLEKTILLKIS